MSVDEFRAYLEDELQVIEQQIGLLTTRASRIRHILRPSSGGDAVSFEVTELPYDAFKSVVIWPITATTTMGRCREALQHFGREATAKEIKALIEHQFGPQPAKSIVEMLRKRSADSRSGVYRVAVKGSPAKYGLTRWSETGKKNPDGSHSPADESVPY